MLLESAYGFALPRVGKPGNRSKNATIDFKEITERVLRTICFAQLRGKMWKEDAQEARR